MEGIRPIVVVQQPQKKQNRTLQHAGNVALVTGGVATTGYLAKKANKNFTKMVFKPELPENGKIFKSVDFIPTKIGKVFQKIGEKIFNPNNKLYGKPLQNLKNYLNVHNVHLNKYAKGKAALFLTAGITALGIITAGIYNAGKINAD